MFGTGTFTEPPGRIGDGGDGQAPLSRHVSLKSSLPGHAQETSMSLSHANTSTSGATHHDSPLGNIQRTLATLQPKLDALQLQPRLDKARYKAEAGLSRRGFVRDGRAGKGGLEGEEEEGLMDGSSRGRDGWDGVDGVVLYDRGRTDGRVSERGGEGGAGQYVGMDGSAGHGEAVWDEDGAVGVEKDNLKWPTGEGWKPL